MKILKWIWEYAIEIMALASIVLLLFSQPEQLLKISTFSGWMIVFMQNSIIRKLRGDK